MSSQIKTIPLADFLEALKAQQAPDRSQLCFICPMCDTVQSGADLIAAGAGKDFAEVEKHIGFNCIGRFTHHLPPPARGKNGVQIGCNWSLGGLFHFHKMVVVMPDGKEHPHFEVATPQQAKAHWEKKP